jgi:hypothetical protein
MKHVGGFRGPATGWRAAELEKLGFWRIARRAMRRDAC